MMIVVSRSVVTAGTCRSHFLGDLSEIYEISVFQIEETSFRLFY